MASVLFNLIIDHPLPKIVAPQRVPTLQIHAARQVEIKDKQGWTTCPPNKKTKKSIPAAVA
jgi:hypothetical protein